MRTMVELPDEQVKALARLCQTKGISRAEAIRQAVDKLVTNDEAARVQEDRQAGFGLWQGHQPDGRSYVEALRREWDNRSGAAPHS